MRTFDDSGGKRAARGSNGRFERRTCGRADEAARKLPQLVLEEAPELVHLYGELESPKYEKAAMRWLKPVPD
jgi:hypothetical protein